MKCFVFLFLVVVVSKRSLCPKKYVWGKKSVQNKEGKLGKCVSLEQTWKLSLNSSVVHSLMFAYVILCVSSFHVFNPSQNFDDRSRLSNIMILPSIKLSLQKRMQQFSILLNPIFKLSTQVHPAFSSSQRFDDSRQFFSIYLSATMMRISALFITGAAALSVGRTDGLMGRRYDYFHCYYYSVAQRNVV